jgi:predicted Fe-Mo cluster-binding NifX family protein
MKIAVTYDNGQVFGHFGHTEQFKIYEIENGGVSSSWILDTNGSGHGALADLLCGQGVELLICGGIGAGAQEALRQAGIGLIGGVSGHADDRVADYLAGRLEHDPSVQCNHGEHPHVDGCTGQHGGCRRGK